MDLGLTHRTALVVGASAGIGYAVAERLLGEGMTVTLVARHEEPLRAAARRLTDGAGGGQVRVAVGDVRDSEQMAAAVETALGDDGQLDVLVTNAAGPAVGESLAVSDAQWTTALDTLLLSALRLIRASHAALRRSDAAAIACINSYIWRVPPAGRGLSSVPRAGLSALVKTLAAELAPDNIRINNVCPGPIFTDRARELLGKAAERNGTDLATEKQRVIDDMLLLNRYGEATDVADMVAFLVSPRAAFVTAATIPVDGGTVRGIV